MTVSFPYARNHPVLHAAPTFKPIARGRRKKGIEKIYKGSQGTLTTAMFYELDIADQDLLLAILAFARSNEHREPISPENTELKDLELEFRSGIISEKTAYKLLDLPALKLSLKRYEILKEIQRPICKQAYEWLSKSLKRLSFVNYNYTGKTWSGSFNMLSYRFNEETEMYDIYINPISAYSIWGTDQYINLNRTERHALSIDAAKSLHSYLNGTVRKGESKGFYLDTLCDAVFHTEEEVSVDAKKRRRKTIRKAIEEINKNLSPSWKITLLTEKNKTLVNVKRGSETLI